ncbi:YchJ family protein [Demequina capsici]|uniref:YchJ family protein n=1 Tax=Demequina capsici TaxID=3075620 RepID=A0AA96FAG1_9MICO|nr:YchJ family protein [Demequina sp. OYTSA14]WNM24605.1 YchJ family protein [Demequina sp. OYTSA14]
MVACPCGSGRSFADCCRPFVRGELEPPTAEALMRSRYTAYARRDEDYLFRTWHESSRPLTLDVDAVDWRGLNVIGTTGGGPDDVEGTVTFVAHHSTGAISTGSMRETSRFVKQDGRWLYVDGDVD